MVVTATTKAHAGLEVDMSLRRGGMVVTATTKAHAGLEVDMFQFLFKYPSPVFTKGRFVLLGTWPAWLLLVLIVAAACGLALLIRWKLREATPKLKSWRAWAIWGTQSAQVALILLLLWQPAMVVSELSSQQNIIAVVVDDSRSMSIADSEGRSEEHTSELQSP